MSNDEREKQVTQDAGSQLGDDKEARDPHLSFSSSTLIPEGEDTRGDLAPWPIEIPNLTIGEQIGRGGSSTVFRATLRSHPERTLAVKVLRDSLSNRDSLLRFNRETNVLQKLDHPNITKLHQFGVTASGQPFLVLEFVEGVRLERYLERLELMLKSKGEAAEVIESRVLNRKLELVIQVCDAVQYAHDQGVLHRDLKPGNIVVTPDGRAMLMDFGLAKGHRDNDIQLEETKSGAIIGTLNFLAPEQVFSIRGGVTRRTDVFGLGAILHVVLTGVAPFSFNSFGEAATEYFKRLPNKLTKRFQVPRNLEAICLKALAPNAVDRYGSAREVADDLRRYLDGKPVAAQANQFARRVTLIHHQYPWLFRNAILLLVAMTLASLFFYSSWQKTEDALAKSRQRSSTLKELLLDLSGRVRDQEASPDTIKDRLLLLEMMESTLGKLDEDLEKDNELLHESAMVDYRLGQVYFHLYSSEKGQAYFGRASEKFNRLAEAGYDVAGSRFGLFHSQLRAGNLDAAYEEIMSLIADSPDNMDYLEAACTMNYRYADSNFRETDFQKVKEYVGKGNRLLDQLKPFPNGWSRICRKRAESAYLQARLLLLNDQLSQAAAELEKSVAFYEQFPVLDCPTESEACEQMKYANFAMAVAALDNDFQRVAEIHKANVARYQRALETYTMRPHLYGHHVCHLIDLIAIAKRSKGLIDEAIVNDAIEECESILAVWFAERYNIEWLSTSMVQLMLLTDQEQLEIGGEVVALRDVLDPIESNSICKGRASLRLGEFDLAREAFVIRPNVYFDEITAAYLKLLDSDELENSQMPNDLLRHLPSESYLLAISPRFMGAAAGSFFESDLDYLARSRD